jgi:beta-glucosidase
MKFPDGFLWGAATSAYQIEGAVDEDGREPSIWDTYSHTPGNIDGGGTGDVACDSYHRWAEDLDLLQELNLNAYRFSIAWPRMGDRRGVAHYDRLIDGLLERGIEPVVTLYHWDLPQRLEDQGGWRNRDTVDRFVEFATTCYEAYGDRVKWWLTINEPWIVGLLGYLHGLHAPGYSDDVRGEVEVFHHLLLAHGRAVDAYRATGHTGKIGLAPNLSPHYPASDSDADREVTWASDGYVNRWFLDPIFRGSYPEDQLRRYEELLGPLDFIRDGDLEQIHRPGDYLGINYYSFRMMEAVPGDTPWPWRVIVPEGTRTTGGFTDGVPRTEAGTPIVPWAFTDLLERVHRDYGPIPIMITENGAVFAEPIHDAGRVQFVHDHVEALGKAIEAGVPVIGYCHWSLLDNFEWKLGYAQRFGLVHVDYDTLERTPKDSARYYARIAAANELVPPE